MHAVLAFSALPLLLGALLSDWAYAASYQIQWTNFAAWLNAGGLVIIGLAMLWLLIAVLSRRTTRHRATWLCLALLAASLLIGFVNALVHAKDAWASMPTGLVLSVVVLVLAAVASAVGLADMRRRVPA